MLLRLLLFSFLLLTFSAAELHAQQKNSTRKIRIKPADFSGQCGSAVKWRESVAKAQAESKTSGKPVFWYVPTIGGSFMDRKPVIDQYMMAGPFSWPAIAGLLNDHFVPVKAIATRELQAQFKHIKTYEFVEPGFVVLNSDGSVKATIDQITTLDPYWISSLLAGWAGTRTPELWSSDVKEMANTLRAGTPREIDKLTVADENRAEQILLQGMVLFRQGLHERARQVWATAREVQPDHPLAWKASAEAENWGPFVRGFEVHRLLPTAAYKAGTASRGSAAPPQTWTEDQLWLLSTDYLLNMQHQNGGWFDSDYDFGGTDSLPNVHVAVSAICGNALLAALSRGNENNDRLKDAIHRAAQFCSDRDRLNYDDRDEILWAHAYRVRFLAKLVSTNDEWRSKYSSALNDAVKDLESVQTKRGTWYHEYPNSFVTATALTALKRAADAGANVDQAKIQLGVASLANDRFDNGAFPYYGKKSQRNRGGGDSSGAGKIPESAGRMPLCELGLWQWGGSSDERLQFALNSAFENHKYLAAGYKYDNHTSTMAYGGFFFWYDMRSRAETLGFMTDPQRKKELADQHRTLVLSLPELDGCFVDSHELGRCYGTAMALLTLDLLDQMER